MKVRNVSGNIVRILNTDALLKCSGIVAMGAYFETSKSYDGLYTIKKTDSSANAITIYPATGETIDGASSVTLTTENEYKTFAPVDGGWTVVDSFSNTGQVINTPTLRLTKDTPVNAAASTLTLAAADIALIGNDDTVGFGGSTFTKVASGPAAGEFTNTAGLSALINALTAWGAAVDGSDIDITAAVKGTASDGTVLTITKLEDTTANGAEAAKANATIAGATLAQMAAGDTVTFDGSVFTKAAATSVEDGEFADTAGLILCIDGMDDWAAVADTADIAITAAENGAANNDKDIVIALKRATDKGVDGTVAGEGETVFDATHVWVCTAANTISGTNWKSTTLS